MSNVCAITVKVTGDDRQSVKRLFDEFSVPTEYGCEWRIHNGVIRCDAEHGDGITAEPEAIIIKGETDWDLQFNVVQKLSQQFPDLTFEIRSTELTNLFSQRWIFEAGSGRLLDCIQNADNDEPRIDYMLNGVQFQLLPKWVATIEDDFSEKRSMDLPEDSGVPAPSDRVGEGNTDEVFLKELEEKERQQGETEPNDPRRDSARRELNDLLSKGRDPHEACCMVIYEILHVDADVVAGDYVDSFLDWAFEGDAAERDRWRAMVGADIDGVQETRDFKKEGF